MLGIVMNFINLSQNRPPVFLKNTKNYFQQVPLSMSCVLIR